jgi:lipopolysaccharide/colanic/teichoic acid biosynthesis glycosyltransferase
MKRSDFRRRTKKLGMTLQRENTFYGMRGKRFFDAIAAACALVLLSPILIAVALLVKLSSPGPVFFRQERVGRDGRIFRIAKFRSMFVATEPCGLPITSAGDPRITALGAQFRRFKLDELPQLWNVLTGEMSFVGPRPEVEKYVEHYSDVQRRVLSVRPGITDPASIFYRHEEKLLDQQNDPEGYYQQVILPHKLDLNLKYIRHITLAGDLSLMLQTIACICHIHKWTPNTEHQSRT